MSSESRFYRSSLKCRNGGHTSHLFGTYCRSLWCLTKTTGVWREVTEQDVIVKPMFWHTVSVQVQSTYVLTYCVSTSTVNQCSDILCQYKYSQPMFWHTVSVPVQSTNVLTYCVSTSTVSLCSDILCQYQYSHPRTSVSRSTDPPSTTPGQLLHSNFKLCV